MHGLLRFFDGMTQGICPTCAINSKWGVAENTEAK